MVLGSSILSIIATIILPTVQNSMLSIRNQEIIHQSVVAEASPLADLASQRKQMSSNFVLTSFSITWLEQNPSAFTTKEYAVAPFAYFNSQNQTDLNTFLLSTGLSQNTVLTETYITSSSTRYWTELSCWSPSSIYINLTTNSVSFDDGRGCFAQDMLSFNDSVIESYESNAPYEAFVFGPGTSTNNPFTRSFQEKCPDNPHLFLMTWRKSGSSMPDFSEGGNATAMFCEPSYFAEPINATVRASDYSLVSYTTAGPKELITGDDFNITLFEYIITFGVPPNEFTLNNTTLAVDANDDMYVVQRSRINDLGVVAPTQTSQDITIGFALGLTQYAVEDYIDFNNLSTAFVKAHQLLFSQAISQSFQQGTGLLDNFLQNSSQRANASQTAYWATTEEVVRIVPGFAFAMESFLVVSASLCLALTLTVPRRLLHMGQNPDSMAEIAMLSRSSHFRSMFAEMGARTEQFIDKLVKRKDFQLSKEEGLTMLEKSHESDIYSESPTIEDDFPTDRELKWPLEMSWTVSCSVLILLVASPVFLLVLNNLSKQGDGLDMPSDSEFVQQLVLNFVPTATVTLLGVYLSLLCRTYSFVKPMQDLAGGNAKAEGTLCVRYTSLPPQLLFWQAFKVRHYLLGTMSVLALLSNVATVTIASIFVQQQTDIISSTFEFRELYYPNVIDPSESETPIKVDHAGIMLSTNANEDAFFQYHANLTSGLNLPSWTSSSSANTSSNGPNYAILPLEIPESVEQNKIARLNFETTGYGADLDCFNFFDPPTGTSTEFSLQDNGTSFRLWINYTTDESDEIACTILNEYWVSKSLAPGLGKLTTSMSAFEITFPLSVWNDTQDAAFLDIQLCSRHVVQGWVRGRQPPASLRDPVEPVDYNATILVCNARLLSQQLSVDATTNGSILAIEARSPPIYDNPGSVNLSATLNAAIGVITEGSDFPSWHNDSLARDNSNILIKDLIGSRDWLDPSLPPPLFENASSTLSEVFSRLFSIQLALDRSKLKPIDNSTSIHARDGNTEPASTTSNVPATATTTTRRVFISEPNFIITVTLLVLDLIVLAIFRFSLPKPFLPRMPFTIASQIAFLSNSHVIDDVVDKSKDFREYRYWFGEFVGKEGKKHIGIEREPLGRSTVEQINAQIHF